MYNGREVKWPLEALLSLISRDLERDIDIHLYEDRGW